MEPQFACSMCLYRARRPAHLRLHILNRHQVAADFPQKIQDFWGPFVMGDVYIFFLVIIWNIRHL